VSDLQAILDLPQPTVSRHLTILRQAGVVHDTPVGPFVLYRLPQENTASRRLLDAALEALTREGEMKAERRRALDRHRSHTRFQIPQGALPA
jgi:ArsR family transcriptional regulator